MFVRFGALTPTVQVKVLSFTSRSERTGLSRDLDQLCQAKQRLLPPLNVFIDMNSFCEAFCEADLKHKILPRGPIQNLHLNSHNDDESTLREIAPAANLLLQIAKPQQLHLTFVDQLIEVLPAMRYQPQLEKLGLTDNNNDQAIEVDLSALALLTSLTELTLSGIYFGNNGARFLLSLRNLERLHIHSNHLMTELPSLRGLPMLDHIRVSGCRNLASLDFVDGCEALTFLDAWSTDVTDIRWRNPPCSIQSLNVWSTNITELAFVDQLPNLSELNIRETPIANLERLRGNTGIKKLYVWDCDGIDPDGEHFEANAAILKSLKPTMDRCDFLWVKLYCDDYEWLNFDRLAPLGQFMDEYHQREGTPSDEIDAVRFVDVRTDTEINRDDTPNSLVMRDHALIKTVKIEKDSDGEGSESQE